MTDGDDDADESGSPAIPSSAHVRKTIDDLLSFTEHPDVDKSLLPHECNDMLRILRDNEICCQNCCTYCQATLHSFFRPQNPDEPQPSTSGIKRKQPERPEDNDE